MSRLLRVSWSVSSLLLSWQLATTTVSAQPAPSGQPTPAPGPPTPEPRGAAPTQPADAQAPEKAAPEQPRPEQSAPDLVTQTGDSTADAATESSEAASTSDEAPPPTAEPGASPSEEPNEASRTLMEPRVIDTSGMDDEPEEPPVDPNTVPFTYHMRHIDLGVGVRVVGAPDDGLQPFLVDPVFGEVYLRGGYAFPIADRFAIAGLLEGSVKELQATARDIPTNLTLGYVSLGIEGRYHAHHRLFFYARVAPGIETGRAAYGEKEGSNVHLTDWKSAFQLDGTLGAALRFAGASDGRQQGVRFWGFMEGGYRYTGKQKFELEAENGPERVQPIALDPLTTRGGFFSTGLMLTF